MEIKKGLTNNQLKIIALVTMTIDHIGSLIFPEIRILRIIGRIAFPIFAYMIAEGCKYTKNRKKYLGLIAGEALLCQLMYFFAEDSLYMCVLVTFSMSITIIFLGEKLYKDRKLSSYLMFALMIITSAFVCQGLPSLITYTDFEIDYGFFGVMMPVVIYFTKDKKEYKLLSTAIMCVILGIMYGRIQFFGLIAVLPLIFYSGKRGKINMKYLFYIYYPLHLVIIYAVYILI